jgi:hypothetical protein
MDPLRDAVLTAIAGCEATLKRADRVPRTETGVEILPMDDREAQPPRKPRKRGLLAALARMQPLDEDFGPIEDLPAEPFDLTWDDQEAEGQAATMLSCGSRST